VIAKYGKAAQRRNESPQYISAWPGMFGQFGLVSREKSRSDEISRENHKVGLLSISQTDHAFEMLRGLERVEVDVTELRNANTVERRRQALERYLDWADGNLMRLVKTRSESAQGTSGQHCCAESNKFASGENHRH
jgi:hypothetical protein